MNWVRENVASAGQNVRGIIVASEVDETLRYAAKGLPNVSVKTYSVSSPRNQSNCKVEARRCAG